MRTPREAQKPIEHKLNAERREAKQQAALDAYVKRVVDAAPPLTREQAALIARLLAL